MKVGNLVRWKGSGIAPPPVNEQTAGIITELDSRLQKAKVCWSRAPAVFGNRENNLWVYLRNVTLLVEGNKIAVVQSLNFQLFIEEMF